MADKKFKEKKKLENIEILLRLYCSKEEIEGKISNYNKYQTLQTQSLINKDFIEEYKKHFDYKNFIKKLIDPQKNNELFKCIKDENGIINHDKLDENDNLLFIKGIFINTNNKLVEKINKIDTKDKNLKKENINVNIKNLETINILLMEKFELINQKIYDLISEQLDFKTQYDSCRFFIGKDYIFFSIYKIIDGSNHIISELGKFDNKNNNFKIEYVFNYKKEMAEYLIAHVNNVGVDAIINSIKNNSVRDENEYILGNNKKINYYKIDDKHFKFINKKKDKDKNKRKKSSHEKDEIQKLTYLYCYYSDMFKQIYSNNKSNESEKVYLINSKTFSKIKIDFDYKMFKNELDNNSQIKEILKKKLNILDLNSIIKLLPNNEIEKYKKKKKIKIEKNIDNIFPSIISKAIPILNDSIMFYNEFEILDEEILNDFLSKANIINNKESIETKCLYEDGNIILNLPRHLNNNKYYITLIGISEDDTFIFKASHILVYFNEYDQKAHLENVIDDDLNKYLDSLNQEYTPITFEGKNIGIVIKNKIEENIVKNERIKIGLQNIGATCYMNATLQCFAHIKNFVSYFKNNKGKPDVLSDKKTLSYSFKILINNLWPDNYDEKTKPYYAPYEFKEKISKLNPLFQGVAANDSKDLINFIVMTLHEELNIKNDIINISNQILDQTSKEMMFQEFANDFKQRYNSLASQLFYGMNYNSTQCTQCRFILYNYQVYFFLVFPLEEVRKFINQNNNLNNQFNQFNFNINQINQMNLINNDQNNVVDMYQCFGFDRRISLMSGDNAMFCNFCQRTTECNICTNLVYGPNILIIILNRGHGKEFDVKLNFYEELNLSNYIEIKTTGVNYKLIGVITHLGESGMSGHFIAFCRDPIDNIWYKFNDAIVSPVENFKNEVIDYAMPYLLFYQKDNI